MFFDLFFLFILFFLILYFFFLLKIFNSWEINWIFFYVLIWFFIYWFFFYYFSEKILFIISNNMLDILTIKDLQEFTTIKIMLSSFMTFMLFLFLLPIILYNYFKNIVEKNKSYFYFLSFLLYYYYFFLSQLLFNYDLYSSSWDIFSKKKDFFFDFQPNFEFIFYNYKGEFYDIFLFLIYTWFFIFILLKTGVRIWDSFILKNFFFFIFLIFVYYFFGGDGIKSDILIFLITIISFEFFIYILICLYQIKKYINKTKNF